MKQFSTGEEIFEEFAHVRVVLDPNHLVGHWIYLAVTRVRHGRNFTIVVPSRAIRERTRSEFPVAGNPCSSAQRR